MHVNVNPFEIPVDCPHGSEYTIKFWFPLPLDFLSRRRTQSVVHINRTATDVEMRHSRETPENSRDGHEMPAYRRLHDKILYWIRLNGHCLGIDVLDSHYRPSLKTAVPIIVASICVIFTGTTVLYADEELALGAGACIRVMIKVITIFKFIQINLHI